MAENTGRQDLGGYCGNGRPFYPPMENKDIKRIQDCVEGCANQDTIHGKPGVPIRPCHIGHCDSQNTERHSHEDDGGVIPRVRHNCFRGAKHAEQGIQEEKSHGGNQDSDDEGHGKQVVQRQVGLPNILFPQFNSCISTATGAGQGRERHHDGHHWK